MSNHPGFRITVEDLENGEKQAMVVYPGDYILIPFEPCYRAQVQAYPTTGTHVITIKGHSPAQPGREVPSDQAPEVTRG
jgi:hypothetical protein